MLFSICGHILRETETIPARAALAGGVATIYHTRIHQGVSVMKLIYAAAALAMLAVSPAFADCAAPTPPQSIPDGSSATLQQMLASKKAVSDFRAATNAYLDCLKSEHQAALAAAGSQVSDDQKAQLDKAETDKHNAAVDKLQTVADRFNEQVRAFKSKSAPKS